MSELFSTRSLLYWWGVLSATVFVKDWIRQFAEFLKTSNTFTTDKIPFNLLPGLNSWIDGISNFVRDTVKFKPNDPILAIGSITIQSWVIAIIFGLILIGLTVMLYVRALKSEAWFDDFIVLLVIYIVLRLEGHIVALSGLPIVNNLRIFVDNPGSAYLVIMVLLLVLTFFGEGFRSKRAFWRAVIEATLVSLFMFPREASVALGYIVAALADFGAGLSQPANVPFAVTWGVIGMALALQRLIMQEGGGGGGGHGGGGGPPRARARAD